MKANETDRHDAAGLAQLARTASARRCTSNRRVRMGVLFESETLAARMNIAWHHDTAPSRSCADLLRPDGVLQWTARWE